MLRRAYKYRLRPNRLQREALTNILDLCRELYNASLEEKKTAYDKQKISLNFVKQANELPAVKAVRPEFTEIYSQVLQDVLKRLHKAYDAFFRRVQAGETPGFPRFKGKHRYDSFTFPQVSHPLKGKILRAGGVDKIGERLKVFGLPGLLKVIWHRKYEGIPKTAMFKREGEHWYLILSCEDVPLEVREKTGQDCGLDVGLESFLTLDTGESVENPRPFKAAQLKLRKAQQLSARRKLKSKRQRKAQRLVSGITRKVGRVRRDFHHKTARILVNKFDRIAVEDLNIKGLARGMLAKSVNDVGWGSFLEILTNKAEGAGSEVKKVDARGTSQECASCGIRVKKDLSVRIHTCSECGFTAHRDHNAALNIRSRGFGNGLGRSLRGDSAAGALVQTEVGMSQGSEKPRHL